ncbi:protein of unknown function [Bradyrhizobium vignae]|uniref:Uncharacterized protein n=1 Tax=Bradyrhizobium vignae TaxID=1549949 RepID=A0A2U3PR59_9BRAD|nr:protein of unknown function [Bradyrhizobium vignae]
MHSWLPRSLPDAPHAAFVPALSVTPITFVFSANPGSLFNDLQGVVCERLRARRPRPGPPRPGIS